ncbi:MAG: hypothetical protein ACOYLV_17975 [Rubrivivax sp.]
MGITVRVLAGLVAAAGAAADASAQADAAASRQVYRCPGPPVEYTNELTPETARERGCRIIEALPVTVLQPPRPAPASSPPAPAAAATAATAAPRPEARVDPAAQRARDADARRILEAELRKEEERLAVLKREFNNGEPERRGDERNYARYQERVSEMRAAIQRKEADVAALRREIAKLAP